MSDDNQASNSLSSASFIPAFIHRQSVKKPSVMPAASTLQKLKKLQFEILTSLSILTPKRIKPMSLKRQLFNCQYEKIQKRNQTQSSLHKFGKGAQQLYRQQQNLIFMLSTLIRQFKSSKERFMYIFSKKNNRVFYLYHKNDIKGNYQQSVLVICNTAQSMKSELNEQKITYQDQSQGQNQKLIIKNHMINIFWCAVLNKIVDAQKNYKSFNILTNFTFPYGMEVLPIQLFNGLESQKQFKYIAKPMKNQIGEDVQQVYRISISGMWTVENVYKVFEYLKEVFGEGSFQIQYEVQKITKMIGENQ